MADRQRSQDGKKETEGFVESSDADDAVPGAHGKGADFNKGISGVSRVRGDHEDIPLTKDAADD